MELTFSMYSAWKLIMIAPIVLMMVIPTSVIAQSGFTIYDNKYFTMAYPSDWTVNDTAIGDLSICCKMYHDISFTAPDHDAKVSLEIYGPVFNNSSITLDKSYWLDNSPMETSSPSTIKHNICQASKRRLSP
jgi:hypothetical protein